MTLTPNHEDPQLSADAKAGMDAHALASELAPVLLWKHGSGSGAAKPEAGSGSSFMNASIQVGVRCSSILWQLPCDEADPSSFNASIQNCSILVYPPAAIL
jgi:hypothetical protein